MRWTFAAAVLALSVGAPIRTAGAGPEGAEVRISDFAFAPREIRVKRGATVHWQNQDQEPHTVTSDADAFGSRGLDAGEGYAFTFEKAGRFPYHCALHPMMTGTVVVE
ncbi:MAG TPA: cupredoxin family copper-binding protein [Anaeromyxobacteraceae bacterium]|nr:cupredoxin family copper-binding protein [Anaeromyxobacteraceae bacterium]